MRIQYPISLHTDRRLPNQVKTQSFRDRLCNIGKRHVVIQTIRCNIVSWCGRWFTPLVLRLFPCCPPATVSRCDTDRSSPCVADKGKTSWSSGCRPCRRAAGSWWCSWRDWWSCSRWPTLTPPHPLHPAQPHSRSRASLFPLLFLPRFFLFFFTHLQLWLCLTSSFQSFFSHTVSHRVVAQ